MATATGLSMSFVSLVRFKFLNEWLGMITMMCCEMPIMLVCRLAQHVEHQQRILLAVGQVELHLVVVDQDEEHAHNGQNRAEADASPPVWWLQYQPFCHFLARDTLRKDPQAIQRFPSTTEVARTIGPNTHRTIGEQEEEEKEGGGGGSRDTERGEESGHTGQRGIRSGSS